ncbi:FG-GAP repeat domain-containing protein [Vibrio campbellii]|uniref:FG-GAP repeat domain-containing protein n=1 Tax=Vibrio campbellii TaxID=680 RepID=UPI00142DEB67|nr:VCBS repeat-containing protein [Vibrio campbellii]NIY88121.1 hypothetical protein [Vibrio campbellii]NVK71783.1 VCBS repeat-containing protein [Vibrio campbellii]
MKKILLANAIVLSFAGCGGGKDSKTNSTEKVSNNAIPVISPISAQSLVETETLYLSVDATDNDGQISTYQWVQTNGTAATLSGIDTQEIEIQTPNVATDETLTFKVTVTDNQGATASETVSISLIDRPNLSIGSISLIEGDEGETAFTLTAQLDKAWNRDIQFDFTPQDISAILNDDYILTAGQATISAGELSTTIQGEIIGDTLYKDDDDTESFLVLLSNLTDVDEVTIESTVTIKNDDLSKQEAYSDLQQQIMSLTDTLYQETLNFVAQTPNTREVVYPKYYSIDAQGDGDLDVIFISSLYDDDTNYVTHYAEARLFVNNQGKGFQLQKLGFTVNGRNIQVGDFDGNGYEDVYFTEHGYDRPPFLGHQDMLMLQTSAGIFENVTTTNLPQYVQFGHSVCGGDMTGDGKDELVLASGSKHNFLLNDGAANFQFDDDRLPIHLLDYEAAYEQGYLDSSTQWSPDYFEHGYWDCLFADMDGDGAKDLLYGGNVSQEYNLKNAYQHDVNSKHLILTNNGSGQFVYSEQNLISFQVNTTLSRVGNTVDVEEMDFDGDNCADFVSFTNDFVETSINVFRNQCGAGVQEVANFVEQYWVENMEVITPTKMITFGWSCPDSNFKHDNCPTNTIKTRKVLEYVDGKIQMRDLNDSEKLELSPANYAQFF